MLLLGFKCLTQVFEDNPKIQNKVENLLEDTDAGTGGWKDVAHMYNMEKDAINHLARHQDAGKSVIGYLTSFKPELTVYEFCKYLKDIKRNDIIKALSEHLVSVAK